MAAFAVLHGAWQGQPALTRSGAGDFRVSQEMLIHSGALACPGQLQGLDLAGLIAVLRPHHDRLLTPDGVLAPVCDDLAGQRALAPLANLADLAAHRLIVAEIRARALKAVPQGATATAARNAAAALSA